MSDGIDDEIVGIFWFAFREFTEYLQDREKFSREKISNNLFPLSEIHFGKIRFNRDVVNLLYFPVRCNRSSRQLECLNSVSLSRGKIFFKVIDSEEKLNGNGFRFRKSRYIFVWKTYRMQREFSRDRFLSEENGGEAWN